MTKSYRRLLTACCYRRNSFLNNNKQCGNQFRDEMMQSYKWKLWSRRLISVDLLRARQCLRNATTTLRLPQYIWINLNAEARPMMRSPMVNLIDCDAHA